MVSAKRETIRNFELAHLRNKASIEIIAEPEVMGTICTAIFQLKRLYVFIYIRYTK